MFERLQQHKESIIRYFIPILAAAMFLFWSFLYSNKQWAETFSSKEIILYAVISLCLIILLDRTMKGMRREAAYRLAYFALFAANAAVSRIFDYNGMLAAADSFLILLTSLPYLLYVFHIIRKFIMFSTVATAEETDRLEATPFVNRILLAAALAISGLLGLGTHLLI